MRAFCTVSAPLEVCAPPSRPLPPGTRFLALKLLGTPQPRTLYFLVEAKSRVREVYAQTCHHFSKQGMLDTELFGLAVLIDGEYLFADPESKLSKYGPKSWRSSHTHGLDANGKPLLELHFRVQFYIESPLMLRDEVSRHNYYLQLKYNAVNRDLPKECSEQSLLLLGGLSLQADLGDCQDENGSQICSSSSTASAASSGGNTTGGSTSTNNTINNNTSVNNGSSNSSTSTTTTSSSNSNNGSSCNINSCSTGNNEYFRPEEYINPTLRSAWGITALTSCHRENRGMSRADAETHYIREACHLNEVINAHVFHMKLSKNEVGMGSVLLSIYAKGIRIAVENSTTTTFNWPSIGKLSFDRKKFEIRSGDNKITLYSVNDDKNKMILALCRETHQFSMKIAPRLTEAIKREEEESSCIHGYPYLYSRALNLPYKSKSDQRISVISSTSSNTTSGIVSDRVHSEDELEIIINTPPSATIAAPSTESLALAHLLDCPSVSRQTSSVGQVSIKDLEGTLAALSVRSNATIRSASSDSTEVKERSVKDCDSSPSSQHNIGSQCSSTCSTVVVANDCISLPQTNVNGTIERRQTSTCSSLELGYSHTAQNSTLSVATSTCLDHDINEEEEETNSGVYTLTHAPPTETSGVYTMNSSEMTGQSSEIAESESHESSHYGSFQPCQSEMAEPMEAVDSVDGDFRARLDSNMNEFRLRSDSNISAAGSFRGDGSDPTDNKHSLLSAEELTDLIVGRGTYPARKTVSHTLDSDCDYVTLPLPLEGESYLQGSEDTAPTEDEYDDDVLPPAPPKRIDSNIPTQRQSLLNLACSNDSPPPPPPYNSHHETTGLRGPDIRSDEAPVIPLRDPPPYPQKPTSMVRERPVPVPIMPTPSTTCIPAPPLSEEVPARFITTRPQINILKAHTSVVGETPKPSFAAPTVNNISNLSQSPISAVVTAASSTASAIGIPVVPYHKSITSPPPPYLDMPKPPHRTCVLLPVIKPRQYHPPPPPTIPRQPPPPPPTHALATVYTGQLARSQIELYQQQLYSDVDYVIYPIQDPSISQQEYLDAKQGSILAAMAQSPPPPPYLAYHTVRAHNRSWDACKNHAIYRSTPYLSMALSSNSRYASTQNLSDTYVQLPGAYSPLYSPSVASLCSSYEPPPPPPLRPRPISSSSSSMFIRSRSDDNILNSVESTPKIRRLPPPPPPPYETRKANRKPPIPLPIVEKQTPPAASAKATSLIEKPPEVPAKPMPTKPTGPSAKLQAQIRKQYPDFDFSTLSTNTSIDIKTLREKSKNLDLPLISALMHDRSLLKQTRAFVMPKHPSKAANVSPPGMLSTPASPNQQSLTAHKSKYPVSGLSTTQLAKPRKSSVVSHRHPNDKLPPLPGQTATEGNNYVMDPTPAKQKSYSSSQPSA
ncbi:protein expanded [Wyeomyia smithii]|uniref:protein expanded n=1 Tax=Wyeomyia smithii TaxID=174621 RepID=UPI002468206B|nr:protein expanded [Wyeomyia smithii]XP_055542250.1 protein expanded [Wyeomyia smithii]